MSDEQRADALRKAAEARQAKSAALAEVKNGTITLTAALSGQDTRLQRAKVSQVLRALPGVGAVTADKALAEAGVADGRRVAGLGPRQREALAAYFAA
jgi:hypothetical protein